MIKDGVVVSMHYELTNAAGEVIDKSDLKEPLVYLHGSGQIIPGLEQALLGLKVGDKKTVVVPPDEAYGEVDPQLIFSLERKEFPENMPLEPGVQFMMEMQDGEEVMFTVQTVGKDDVEIDGNHPLAGETLHFKVEIAATREATKEEREHGHAHGAGGHHHH